MEMKIFRSCKCNFMVVIFQQVDLQAAAKLAPDDKSK